MRADFYCRLRAVFPMLTTEYFSNVINASGVFPRFFSLPSLGPDSLTDWMFGASYDAYSDLWTESGTFNAEFSKARSDSNPLIRACAHASRSAAAAGSRSRIFLGIFPDTNSAWLRSIISQHGGHLEIVFPVGTVPFVHLHTALGRTKFANRPFTRGVVIASFRSPGYAHTPPSAAVRHLHEWAAIACPRPRLSGIKWCGAGLSLSPRQGPLPVLPGSFIPRWPELRSALSWADPSWPDLYPPSAPLSRRVGSPSLPFPDDHPISILHHIPPLDRGWCLRGLMPLTFADLLTASGMPSDALTALTKTHLARTFGAFKVCRTKHTDLITLERKAEALGLSPSPPSPPSPGLAAPPSPVVQRCFNPPRH